MRGLRALLSCGFTLVLAAQPLAQVADPLTEPNVRKVREAFTADGIRLFDKHADLLSRGYQCSASMYAGMNWCISAQTTERRDNQAFTKLTGYNSDSTGRVVYVVSVLGGYPLAESGWTELVRTLSSRYGAQPTTLTFKVSEGGREMRSLIAVWGEISLKRLTEAEYQIVATGASLKQGYLIDHRFNQAVSAKDREPVFKVEGKAGFILHLATRDGTRSDMVLRSVYQPAFTPSAVPTPSPPSISEKPRAPAETKKESPEARRAKIMDALGADIASKLVDGDAEDIIFLFNETSSAPNGVRGLSGDVKFKDGQVSICHLFPTTARSDFIEYARREALKWGAVRLVPEEFERHACSPNLPPQADLVAVERKRLLASERELSVIVDLLKSKRMTIFRVLDVKAFRDLRERQTKETERLTTDLRAGKLKGHGILIVHHNGRGFCALTSGHQFADHRLASRFNSEQLDPTLVVKGGFNVSRLGADELFIRAKRTECKYLIGDAERLRTIHAALTRDGLDSHLHWSWIAEDEYQAISKVAEQEMRAEEARRAEEQRKRMEEERRRADEARRVEEQRRRADEAERKMREEKKQREDAEFRSKPDHDKVYDACMRNGVPGELMAIQGEDKVCACYAAVFDRIAPKAKLMFLSVTFGDRLGDQRWKPETQEDKALILGLIIGFQNASGHCPLQKRIQ